MRLNLLVLYVSDLERSRRFYELLGLNLVREQHGGGPVHYSAGVSGAVLELYPAGDRPITRTRLGFGVSDPDAVTEALRVERFTVKRRNLAIDPDGNRVELTISWDGVSDLPEEEPDDAARKRIAALKAEPPDAITGEPYDPDEVRRKARERFEDREFYEDDPDDEEKQRIEKLLAASTTRTGDEVDPGVFYARRDRDGNVIRDDAFYRRFSAAVEDHDYTIAGPVELGPAATPELRAQLDGRVPKEPRDE